jgi:hypothetical protein
MVHPEQEEFCRLWGRLMERAWNDPEFMSRLVADPAEVLAEHGYVIPPGMDVRLQVVASDDVTTYLYLPCAGELRDGTADEAGEVAAECRNNQLVLSRLAEEATRGSAS